MRDGDETLAVVDSGDALAPVVVTVRLTTLPIEFLPRLSRAKQFRLCSKPTKKPEQAMTAYYNLGNL
jgi:hypothetical protein